MDEPNYKEMTFKLWKLLDNIDTCGDVYKPEINNYFRAVQSYCNSRFQYLHSDGYNLFPFEKDENE